MRMMHLQLAIASDMQRKHKYCCVLVAIFSRTLAVVSAAEFCEVEKLAFAVMNMCIARGTQSTALVGVARSVSDASSSSAVIKVEKYDREISGVLV